MTKGKTVIEFGRAHFGLTYQEIARRLRSEGKAGSTRRWIIWCRSQCRNWRRSHQFHELLRWLLDQGFIFEKPPKTGCTDFRTPPSSDGSDDDNDGSGTQDAKDLAAIAKLAAELAALSLRIASR